MKTRRNRCAFGRRAFAGLAAAVLIGAALPAASAAAPTLDAAIEQTAAYLCQTAPAALGEGGEWTVIGLARSGAPVPEGYFDTYYAAAAAYVRQLDGVLHDKKYTEYARVALAMTAIGRDPADVGGYHLLRPLGDFEQTIWQGINGPIWALIALDAGGYEVPANPAAATQATRTLYVDDLLSRQLKNGGFSLTGKGGGEDDADPDITAMALTALARYQERADVRAATARALAALSDMQDADGGYASWGTVSAESTAQVIVALCELGLSIEDPRFVKNGNTLLDHLLSYYIEGGGFAHTGGDRSKNRMATEQSFYAMVAAQRARDGAPRLFDMRGTAARPASEAAFLPGKHADVRPCPVTEEDIAFSDLAGHENRSAIEALAARAVITGMGEGRFAPDETMTRAQFSAIVVRSLGLTPQTGGAFSDVDPGAWYAPYVGAAYVYGIVTGRSAETFDPAGTITRQEAAAMVSRAARLTGLFVEYGDDDALDVLAQFSDYRSSAAYARAPLAFCYDNGILDPADLDIRPKDDVLRGEIAQMLYQLLDRSLLLT